MIKRLEAEHACAALVQGFAYHVDRRDNEAVLGLFTPDGQFNRAARRLNGRDAIRAFLEARDEGLITRHLCQTPFFIEVTEVEARAVTSFTMYVAERAAADLPALTTPKIVGEYADHFVLAGGSWWIARRDTTVVMASS